MPVCAVHLLSLSTPLSHFLRTLRASALSPLTTARVVRWIITPNTYSVSALLHPPHPWHLLLILPSSSPLLPPALESQLLAHHVVTVGVPSRILTDYHHRNKSLLHPDNADQIPPLTGSLDAPRLAPSAQTLELSPDLKSWVQDFASTSAGQGPVSMLNLLAFHSAKAKESYLVYGKAFAERIGARRGGNAKLVGHVIEEGKQRGWDEFALAHYPSIRHFEDMLASEDYQEVNLKYRVPSLKDTCILCTSEVDLPEIGEARL
ncbi:MAG: hypothetical protein Q9227_006022 [Pyrenula ochraceoflavens]